MRDKSNIVKTVKMLVISALWLSFASLNAIAATPNTLSAVEIKDSDDGYQIVLKADKAAEVRKTVESKDDVTLDIKGIIPIESVGTIYNNVPEVDSIIIQPDSDNNTKVIVRGKNISSASISFAPVEVQTAPPVQGEAALPSGVSEIELSKPIQSYAPVFDQSQDFEDQSSRGMFETAVSLSLNKAHSLKPFAVKVFRYLKHLDRKYLAFGSVFFLIIMFGLKNIKADKNDDIKVGLTQSLKEKEIGMKDDLSLANDFQTARSQKSLSGKSVPSINYGIKAYQNSQKNPYTSQISGLPMKNVAKQTQVRPTAQQGIQRNNNSNQNQVQLQSRLNQANAQMQAKKPVSAPAALNKVKPSTVPSISGSKSIDSMKFLESMTKIYERSGREDLANELKSNIQKVQMAR